MLVIVGAPVYRGEIRSTVVLLRSGWRPYLRCCRGYCPCRLPPRHNAAADGEQSISERVRKIKFAMSPLVKATSTLQKRLHCIQKARPPGGVALHQERNGRRLMLDCTCGVGGPAGARCVEGRRCDNPRMRTSARAPAARVGLGLCFDGRPRRVANPAPQKRRGIVRDTGACGRARLLVAASGTNRRRSSSILPSGGRASRFRRAGLACPRQLGCDRRSFWRWGGAPSHHGSGGRAAPTKPRSRCKRDKQRSRADRPARLYLLAWSGGASYLTSVMARRRLALPRWRCSAAAGEPQVGACAGVRYRFYYAGRKRNPPGRAG